jgi:hypothetical protein
MTKSYKSKPKSKKVSKLLPITAASVAIAAVGGGAFYFYGQQNQIVGVMGIAKAIPQEAQVVMAFTTKPEPWDKLKQFGTPDSRKLLGQSLNQSFLNAFLVQSKTDYGQDVQPWIGSHLITALVPSVEQPNSPAATLVIAPTLNRGRSSAFLSKYRDALTQQGAKFAEKEYKGLKYFESPTKVSGQSVITVDLDGKYVAISTSSELIKRTFDTYKGEQASLAQKSNFAAVYSNSNNSNIAEPLSQIYLDGAIALKFIGEQTKLNLAPPLLEQSQRELDAITLAVGTQKEGLRLEVDTHLKNDSSDLAKSSEGKVLEKLPQETFLFVAGVNLNQFWQSLVKQSKGNSNSEQTIKQIRDGVKASIGLDFDQDILKWMTGEFAIAAIPIEQGLLQNAGFGLVVLAQTTDKTATNKLFTKLDNLANASSSGLLPQGAEIKTKKLGNQELTTWEFGKSTIASHGFIDDSYAFWSMGNLAEALIPQPPKPLSNSNTFQTLTTTLPKTSSGSFYLNMTPALTLIDKRIPPAAKSDPNYVQIRAVLDAIRGVAMTNTALNNHTNRLDFLFSLKPEPGN